MQMFWKGVTHLWGFPWMLLLFIPIFFFSSTPSSDIAGLLIIGCVALTISLGAAVFTKYFFFKDRPIPQKSDTFWRKINAGSFPSMHTITVTVILSLVFAGFVLFEFPWYVVPIYALIALAVALSRIELKKHYPIDVLCGAFYAILGTIISLPTVEYLYQFLDKL